MEGRIREWMWNSKNINVKTEWVKVCIDLIHEQRSNVSFDAVYEMFLMTDISDSNSRPEGFQSNERMQVETPVVLQVNWVVNIAASAYSQLLKLKNVLPESIEVVHNQAQTPEQPRRMLKLELTDGFQLISAIEYQPMTKINADLLPGTKILFKDNTIIRSGMLLLNDSSIEILGGCVDKLVEENSKINVLTRLVQEARQDNQVKQDLEGLDLADFE